MPVEISVCAFTGAETLPIQAAQERGFYAAEGLSVHCENAAGSVAQMVGLIDGGFDIAMTAIDNVIAYNAGQGAATPENPADLIVFLGCATDPRPLIARPECGTFAALKGARIAVDAVSTGFSFMLRQLLEDYGLRMQDYELIPVGNVTARWDAVRNGDCAAGLLGKAHAAAAVAAGYTWLRGDPDPWDNYQGGVFTADRRWAAAHREAVTGFIRATLRGVDWVLAPENAADLPEMLVRHLPHMNLSAQAARRAADELHSAHSILKAGLPINMEGTRSVLALRRKYGGPGVPPDALERCLEPGYREAATRV
ncbi:MAG: ABC transporter substrate-binding protein [Alphaproteobacteria bacterium]